MQSVGEQALFFVNHLMFATVDALLKKKTYSDFQDFFCLHLYLNRKAILCSTSYPSSSNRKYSDFSH